MACPTVLIVDDEPQLLELYRHYLGDGYAVRTATDGRQALEQLDDAVDVVLLDRRMPDRSGDDVLAALRDRGFDGPVAMVTAVEPDPAIVDLPIDDYLVKPVSKAAFTRLVTTLLRRATLDEATRDYLAAATKLAVLEATFSAVELDEHPEYRALADRVDTLAERARATLQDLSPGAVDRLVRDID